MFFLAHGKHRLNGFTQIIFVFLTPCPLGIPLYKRGKHPAIKTVSTYKFVLLGCPQKLFFPFPSPSGGSAEGEGGLKGTAQGAGVLIAPLG